jgi:hypothetical protein
MAGPAAPDQKTHHLRSLAGICRLKIPFSPRCQAAFAVLARTETMRTTAVIFVLALITIAGGIYSDAVLTSEQARSAAAPDPATTAIAHAARGSASSPFKGG